jgi:hypothetical protein
MEFPLQPMNRRPLLRSLRGLIAPAFAALLCTAAHRAAAQSQDIQISFTLVASDSNLGYTQGDTYSIAYTANGAYAGGSGDAFVEDSLDQWDEMNPSDPVLFESVTGSAVGGSFQSTPFDADDTSILVVMPGGNAQLALQASNNVSGATGLLTPGLNEITYTHADIGLDSDITSFPGGSANAVGELLSAAAGTYAPSRFGMFSIVSTDSSNNDAEFTIESMTISTVAAVPEPWEVAPVAGALALGLAIWRRRRPGALRAARSGE